ncbi:unnamed protein product, partial [Effrenium voratum]
MGANERVHQEVQKMLGIVVKDVARGHTDHWGDLLAVVEYCIDTTPGPHGYTPRDLGRAWPLGVDLKVGDRVVWRAPGLSDPGAKGRVPWKKGQMIKGETEQVEFTMKRRGKQYVLKIGDVMAFRKGYGPKLCAIGRVTSIAVSEGVVHVHKYAPEIGGLRVKWCLLYLDQQGQESLAPEGGRPCIEEVKMSLLITKVELSRDGILQASSARKLDKGGYRLEERPPAQRDPERRGEHEYSEPLDDLVGILKGGRTESGVGVFAAGPWMASRENRKLSLNTFGMKVCPSTELTSWRFSPDTVGSL